MLRELRIRNFAIIEELTLRFEPGLIVLTGETGAGKSIIVDAIELLLGGRGDANVIRSGEETASVEADFQLQGGILDEVRGILEAEGLWEGDSAVTLGREVRRGGRNIVRVNGRAVNLAILREVSQLLIDVHGQSEHLSLLRTREHLRLLDRFAGLEERRREFSLQAEMLKAVREELEQIRAGERDAARKTDMLTYQIGEIEAARIRPGEETGLLEERTRLANAEQLATLSDQALLALDSDEEELHPATTSLGQAAQVLAALAKIDPALKGESENAQAVLDQAAELSKGLRAYRDSIEFNPKRLELVEERVELLRTLKRKYGDTLEAVQAHAEQAKRELESITHADERRAELEGREQALLREIGRQGAELSELRAQAAETLARGIEAELSELRMEGAKFAVDRHWTESPDGAIVGGKRIAFDSTGLDSVEFLVAPNPGEGLKPLAKVASGGETSRLMLALKSVLARADRTPTLIFDEIDQGIGGRVGMVVGRKLWRLAPRHQVFCVTHLPQLAAYGDRHLRVEKSVLGKRTQTQAKLLHARDRIAELAAMLGTLSETTRESAEEILQLVEQEKQASRQAG
ncbi:MAG: DNA repair protein RecN [Anaerolineales bacterium]|nr:DNA repair protein RecN [Anaerolineales bacterium]